jgi:hypothetical protein
MQEQIGPSIRDLPQMLRIPLLEQLSRNENIFYYKSLCFFQIVFRLEAADAITIKNAFGKNLLFMKPKTLFYKLLCFM